MKKSDLVLWQSKLTGSAVAAPKAQLTYELTSVTRDSDKAERFTSEIMNVARSEVFLTELDKKIGGVKEGETEEQFVTRSKALLKNLLRSKFM
jgi:predicted 2-oxoglutarate/Fe(II)-dependent dioxygenase YbiX